MPKLSKLTHPLLTADVLNLLTQHNLHTWEDLLVADLEGLRALGSESETPLWSQALRVVQEVCRGKQECATGLDLLLARTASPPFSFGCSSLDDLLGGGVSRGTVLELAGSEGSGKTQVCLQVCASAALRHRAAVLYLDSSSSFSAHRLAHTLSGLSLSSPDPQARWSECSRALKCIVCTRTHDIFSALGVLSDLTPSPSHSDLARNFVSSVKVLVLDSVSALCSPVLGGSSPQGHALMMHLGRELLQLAAHQNMAVIVTNDMVVGDDGTPRPGLGESWKGVPQRRVIMEKDGDSNTSKVTLVKHSSLPCGNSVFIKFSDDGVRNSIRVA